MRKSALTDQSAWRGGRTEAAAEVAPERVVNAAMADEQVRRRLIARGRVQGVFFRDSTREQARAEGVAGWARNRSDGGVEVVLEGSAEAVDRVAGFIQQGPGSADVDSVESHDEEPEGLSGFEIR
jgi:acylphosphatase